MKKDAVKVGIIGVGGTISSTTVILNGEPNVQLVALADPDADRRKRVLGDIKGVRVFDDYKQMFDACDLDAVCIGLPTWMHAPVSQEASRAWDACALRKTALKRCSGVNTRHTTRRKQGFGLYVCPAVSVHSTVDGRT